MKISLSIFTVFATVLGWCRSEGLPPTALPSSTPKTHVEAQVGGIVLDLDNSGRNCRITAKNEGIIFLENQELSLQSPCEFVRTGAGKVLSYQYGGGAGPYRVIIVVGGPPSTEAFDDLMPQGCGTEFQALRLYEDKVILGAKIGQERKIFLGCPSGGLDEIYFAEYSK